MSIARAFTRRARRATETQTPVRSATTKYPGGIDRKLISLPTELISTTNVQVYTAPDLPRAMNLSSGSSFSSGVESELSTIDRSFLSHSGSDTSSVDSSPATPVTPQMDDVKTFFDSKFVHPTHFPLAEPIELRIPQIPQRAPSHSKRAHVELSRRKTVQSTSSSPRNSSSRPTTTASSRDLDYPPPSVAVTDPHHPFGRELAQVHEVAEEFGATAAVFDLEEKEILGLGLFKFGVQDYLDEISGLHQGVFSDHLGPLSRPWI